MNDNSATSFNINMKDIAAEFKQTESKKKTDGTPEERDELRAAVFNKKQPEGKYVLNLV